MCEPAAAAARPAAPPPGTRRITASSCPDRQPSTLDASHTHPSLTHLQHGLDDYAAIKLINWLRSEAAAGRDAHTQLAAAAAAPPAGGAAPWSGDAFLAPVVEDDPLITFVLGLEEGEEGGQQEAAGAG